MSDSLEQYDDEEVHRPRALTNLQVLRFLAGFWGRRRWATVGVVVLVTLTVAFETMLPQASRALVDAAGRGPGTPTMPGRRGWCSSAPTSASP